MDWAGKQHPVEMLAEWLAPAFPAASAGWAAVVAGLPATVTLAAAAAAYAGGFLAMRLAGVDEAPAVAAFEPVGLDHALDELLPEAKDAVLLLDDPLLEPDEDSRVVQLFSKPEPTPGELVLRIEDFLVDGRRPLSAAPVQPPSDASAALHAALANIRSSLR